MENPEEVLQSLDEFAKLKPKDIPRELEDYLSYVAKTGDPVYQWSIVKCLFREKLLNVITDFYETSPTIDLPPCPNVDPFSYETMKNSLLERLDSFPSAPFTVQRLCELLTTPRKEYSRADKFMRAIEKNILVVSTREPGNIRRSDNNGQPELLMNGVMDGRGIELGEAIETVSSDGVNLMHSDENEVNVTENENVPVECAGMEEIDMEEQGEHMEASNSSAWEKEQSDVSVQSEENGSLKSYDSNSEEREIKSKENSESPEINSAESSELSATAENVDSFSEAAGGESHTEEDETNTPSDPEVSGGPSTDEEAPKTDTITEMSPTKETPIKEAATESITTDTTSSVVDRPNSTEPTTDSSTGDTSKIDSTIVDNPPAETCTKNVGKDVNVDSTASESSTADIVNKVEDANSAELIPVAESASASVGEAENSNPTGEQVPFENVENGGEKSEQDTVDAVGCQQDEAMDVDENASSQPSSADIDEPMDQSEQLTEGQLES
ncbi:serine/threonine-protein phosphatase 4 regulatory subunit 2-like [Periplaneta americana]|uniref:serine/threonine-protein phosphatase 4 regulatory subunit 2-like n=1 Tax=Periplaneta americana TaxID=6978 RepID=UPI0037E74621